MEVQADRCSLDQASPDYENEQKKGGLMEQRHRRLVAASCCIWLLTVVALVSCQNAPDVAGLRSLATEGDPAQTAEHETGASARSRCVVQDRERPPRERDAVIPLRLHARGGDGPDARVQVHFVPRRQAHFAGSRGRPPPRRGAAPACAGRRSAAARGPARGRRPPGCPAGSPWPPDIARQVISIEHLRAC